MMVWLRILTKSLHKNPLRIKTGRIFTSHRGILLLLLLGLALGLICLPVSKSDATKTSIDTSADNFSIWANQVYMRARSVSKSAAVDAGDQILLMKVTSELGTGSFSDAVSRANATPSANIRIDVDPTIFGTGINKGISVGEIIVGPRTGSLMIVGEQTNPNNGTCVSLRENPLTKIIELAQLSRNHFDQFTCAIAGRRWKSNVHIIAPESPAPTHKDRLAFFKILQGGNLTLRNLSVSNSLKGGGIMFFNSGSLRLEKVAITVTGNATCIVNVGQLNVNASSCAMHDASFGLDSFGEKDRVVSSKIYNSLIVNHGSKVSIFTSGFRYAHKTEFESCLIVTTQQGTAFLDLAAVDATDVVSPVTLRNTTVSGCENECRSTSR